ncbi:hypothetical protein ACFPOB_24560 [Bosea eneae]|uniref:Uncharacterized protein n=1 Tax=Bosea eneae TaxID=151454 RepID=A0ABW0IZT5_9HYPH
MGRPPKQGNDIYRSGHQNFTYNYNNERLFDTRTLLEHLESEKLEVEQHTFQVSKILSICDLDHEFDWPTILQAVHQLHPQPLAAGRGTAVVAPIWLAPVVIVVFPNNDCRVVLGHDHVQVARLLGADSLGVNFVRNVNMEHYQIPLLPVVPEHLKSDPRIQIVTRPVPLQKRKLENPGNSDNTDRLTVAHAIQLLRAQLMFEESGYLIAQARAELEKRNLAPNSWGSFDNLVKTLPPHVVGLNKPKKIKDAFRSDPDMDKRKDPAAWANKLKWLQNDILWLAAAHRQSQLMQKAPHFMEEELEYGPEYKDREEFLTKAALKAAKKKDGEATYLLGLTRIAMLSAVNPADLWLSWKSKRHELEFAAAMGCLSNLQPALLKPAAAQAAIEIRERARTAPASCTEDQFVAVMLIDRLEKTCRLDEFMAAAHLAMRNREPVRIRLADTTLPSGLIVEPISELLSGVMSCDAEAAAL